MRAVHVNVDHQFTAPPERVFAHLAEHENLAEVFGAQITRLRDGDHDRNGVGSCRRLRIGPLPPFEETVIEFVAPRRIVYRISKGSPLRGHLGTMIFSEAPGGGTRLQYDIRLASPIPGLARLVRVMLTRAVTRALPAVDRSA
jgi:uncharacterized protein YndB with AHSA1/START domain